MKMLVTIGLTLLSVLLLVATVVLVRYTVAKRGKMGNYLTRKERQQRKVVAVVIGLLTVLVVIGVAKACRTVWSSQGSNAEASEEARVAETMPTETAEEKPNFTVKLTLNEANRKYGHLRGNYDRTLSPALAPDRYRLTGFNDAVAMPAYASISWFNRRDGFTSNVVNLSDEGFNRRNVNEMTEEELVEELAAQVKIWKQEWNQLSSVEQEEAIFRRASELIINSPEYCDGWVQLFLTDPEIAAQNAEWLSPGKSRYDSYFDLTDKDPEVDPIGVECALKFESGYVPTGTWQDAAHLVVTDEQFLYAARVLALLEDYFTRRGIQSLPSWRNWKMAKVADTALVKLIEADYTETKPALILDSRNENGEVVNKIGINSTDLRPEVFATTAHEEATVRERIVPRETTAAETVPETTTAVEETIPVVPALYKVTVVYRYASTNEKAAEDQSGLFTLGQGYKFTSPGVSGHYPDKSVVIGECRGEDVIVVKYYRNTSSGGGGRRPKPTDPSESTPRETDPKDPSDPTNPTNPSKPTESSPEDTQPSSKPDPSESSPQETTSEETKPNPSESSPQETEPSSESPSESSSESESSKEPESSSEERPTDPSKSTEPSSDGQGGKDPAPGSGPRGNAPDGGGDANGGSGKNQDQSSEAATNGDYPEGESERESKEQATQASREEDGKGDTTGTSNKVKEDPTIAGGSDTAVEGGDPAGRDEKPTGENTATDKTTHDNSDGTSSTTEKTGNTKDDEVGGTVERPEDSKAGDSATPASDISSHDDGDGSATPMNNEGASEKGTEADNNRESKDSGNHEENPGRSDEDTDRRGGSGNSAEDDDGEAEHSDFGARSAEPVALSSFEPDSLAGSNSDDNHDDNDGHEQQAEAKEEKSQDDEKSEAKEDSDSGEESENGEVSGELQEP